MSLGDHTKNDLSFNLAKLDHGAMLTTARLAMGYSMENIRRCLDKLTFPNRKGCYDLDAQRLAKEAGNLAIITETCYTLEESLTREELEIVNKPEVPPEE